MALTTKRAGALLWIAQVLLAALFLFAGGFKVAAPAAMLKGPVVLPVTFLRFIGTCETLGAIGLIVPSVTRIRPFLTPLAASGLVIIMTGATVISLIAGLGAGAAFPAVVGVIAAGVAYGRTKVAPIAERRRAHLAIAGD